MTQIITTNLKTKALPTKKMNTLWFFNTTTGHLLPVSVTTIELIIPNIILVL